MRSGGNEREKLSRPSGGDIEVNWWGFQGQAVGISRSTGGGIPRSRTKGRGIEVKVNKSGGGCVPSPTPSTSNRSGYFKQMKIFSTFFFAAKNEHKNIFL
jgi:hypothetical protein